VYERLSMRFQTSEPLKTLFGIIVALIIFASSLIIIYFLVFFRYPEVFAFLSGLIAGIFGILIGFQLDRVSDVDKDNQRKEDFLSLLHEELLRIKNYLNQRKNGVFPFYTDIWDSIVSSGLIRLLTIEQISKLSKLYWEIRDVSYEAGWVYRSIKKLGQTPIINTEERSFIENNVIDDRDFHKTRMNDLSKHIDEVLKGDWWKKPDSDLKTDKDKS